MTYDKVYSGAKLGFIGVGNMGGALVRAARRNTPATGICIANRSPEKAKALAADIPCRVKTNREIAEWADYIFLGVKPQMMEDLLTVLAPVLAERTDRFVLVSMAAGLSMADIRRMAGGDYPVLRIMPNTPASIGEGMILYTRGPGVTEDEERVFLEAMAGAGRFSPIPEKLMDAGSAVAGCGPAFVCQLIEALADGGVACGLPRQKALLYAAQMTQGAARLMLETNQHPGAMKDAVCSPGGSTIAGVRTLEQRGFRAAAMDAVIAAAERNAELGK